MADPTSTTGDSALRAMTDDGAFRVVVLRATDTVTRTLAAQQLSGTNAERLAELVMGAILVRETMAPTHRLQALLSSPDRSQRLVADSHPDGGTRGLASNVAGDVSIKGWTLEIMRTLYNGDVHRGVVEVPGNGSMSEALMAYLQSSEQVASMLSVACVLDDTRSQVRCAGGYLVQLLPEVGRAPLAIMAERLRDFENVAPTLVQLDAAPSPLLDELLYGMPFTRLEERPLSWKCRCSAVRVMSSLAAIAKADLNQMIDAGQPIELTCDFCRTVYTVSPAQLRGLLEQS
jgi:molecular chaperone Hsp33